MSSRKQHCASCLKTLGKEFSEIHAWLDVMASVTFPCMSHRAFRHHEDGIEEIRQKFGEEAAKAARLHILDDFGYVPKNQLEIIQWLENHGWSAEEKQRLFQKMKEFSEQKEESDFFKPIKI